MKKMLLCAGALIFSTFNANAADKNPLHHYTIAIYSPANNDTTNLAINYSDNTNVQNMINDAKSHKKELIAIEDLNVTNNGGDKGKYHVEHSRRYIRSMDGDNIVSGITLTDLDAVINNEGHGFYNIEINGKASNEDSVDSFNFSKDNVSMEPGDTVTLTSNSNVATIEMK